MVGSYARRAMDTIVAAEVDASKPSSERVFVQGRVFHLPKSNRGRSNSKVICLWSYFANIKNNLTYRPNYKLSLQSKCATWEAINIIFMRWSMRFETLDISILLMGLDPTIERDHKRPIVYQLFQRFAANELTELRWRTTSSRFWM